VEGHHAIAAAGQDHRKTPGRRRDFGTERPAIGDLFNTA
jgi:hypothetical protein